MAGVRFVIAPSKSGLAIEKKVREKTQTQKSLSQNGHGMNCFVWFVFLCLSTFLTSFDLIRIVPPYNKLLVTTILRGQMGPPRPSRKVIIKNIKVNMFLLRETIFLSNYTSHR